MTEILIVYSTKIDAEMLRRRGDGSWPEIPDHVEPDSLVTVASIGFATTLREFHRTTALANHHPS